MSSHRSNRLLTGFIGPFVNAFLETRNRNPGSGLAASIDGFLTVQVACSLLCSPSKAKIVAAACDHRASESSRDAVLFDFVDRTRARQLRSAGRYCGSIWSQRSLRDCSTGQLNKVEQLVRRPRFYLYFLLIMPPSSSPSPDSNQTTGTAGQSTRMHTNAGAIAGGVVGGVVFLVILSALLLFLLRRRRKDRYSIDLSETPNHHVQPFVPERMLRESAPPAPRFIPNEKGRTRTDPWSRAHGSNSARGSAYGPSQTPSASSTTGLLPEDYPAPESIDVAEFRTLVQEISTTLRGLHVHRGDEEVAYAPPEYSEGPQHR
jgi:hypothetical protein